jgi:predicted TIM-barrel enzyme
MGGIFPTYGDALVAQGTFILSAGQNSTVSNSYLATVGEISTNISGYVLPNDSTIIAVAATTLGAETWDAEIRINGAVTPTYTLSITAASQTLDAAANVDLNAGDEVAFYCNGGSIARPNVVAYLVRRID